ncbi:MAG: hypothetical protein GF333_03390 [Candidatus Omnitrophica bacterium]|nr:hypothetical protein [Candidatus Omnitrophota bacterium]
MNRYRNRQRERSGRVKRLLAGGGVVLLAIFVQSGTAGHVSAEEGQKRVLVVYYSRTGYTHSVARKIAERFDADLERLIDTRKRTGPFAVAVAGKDAVAGNRTVLKPLQADPGEYSLILIGTPAWFGNVTPAVRTFVAEYDIAEKTAGLFGTTNLTGIEAALDQLAGLIAPEDSPEQAREYPRLPLRQKDLKEEILDGKIDAFYQEVMNSSQDNPLSSPTPTTQ